MTIRLRRVLRSAAVSSLLLLLLPAFSRAVAQNGKGHTPAPASTVASLDERPEYVIQEGDILGVKFFMYPELNEEVVVRPDGRISLQVIPEVMAAGRTPRELTERLKTLYSVEFDRPMISVIVRSFSSQRVYVDGQVNQPGEFELVGSLTVLQAIARAEGLMDGGRANQVIVVRRSPDGRAEPIPFDLKGYRRGEVADLVLQPFDVVFVPKTRIAQVNQWVDQYVRQNIPVSFGFRIDIVD